MLNKAQLIGHLGCDVELRYTQSGTPVANFRVATNEYWNDKNGERKERTEWHRIVAWGKVAELCGEYLSKGRQVYIEGSLRTRAWDDRDGNKRYTTEITAQNVRFLGGRPGGQKKQTTGNAEDIVDMPQENIPPEEQAVAMFDESPPF